MSFEAQRRFLYQAKPEREVEKFEPFSAKKNLTASHNQKTLCSLASFGKNYYGNAFTPKRSKTVPLQSASQRNIPILLKLQKFPKLPKSTKCTKSSESLKITKSLKLKNSKTSTK